MEGELFEMVGSEARINKIPNLRIGPKVDLTKSDSSLKITPGGIKGSQKEEIRAQNSYAPKVDDRGSKLAEKLMTINQRNQKPSPSSTIPPIPAASDSVKTIGTMVIVGSLLAGFLLGRWSTKIQFSIGE